MSVVCFVIRQQKKKVKEKGKEKKNKEKCHSVKVIDTCQLHKRLYNDGAPRGASAVHAITRDSQRARLSLFPSGNRRTFRSADGSMTL